MQFYAQPVAAHTFLTNNAQPRAVCDRMLALDERIHPGLLQIHDSHAPAGAFFHFVRHAHSNNRPDLGQFCIALPVGGATCRGPLGPPGLFCRGPFLPCCGSIPVHFRHDRPPGLRSQILGDFPSPGYRAGVCGLGAAAENCGKQDALRAGCLLCCPRLGRTCPHRVPPTFGQRDVGPRPICARRECVVTAHFVRHHMGGPRIDSARGAASLRLVVVGAYQAPVDKHGFRHTSISESGSITL